MTFTQREHDVLNTICEQLQKPQLSVSLGSKSGAYFEVYQGGLEHFLRFLWQLEFFHKACCELRKILLPLNDIVISLVD